MASLADRGRTLRLHEAFAEAPDEVLRALGKLFSRARPATRERARTQVRRFLESRPILSTLPDSPSGERKSSAPPRERRPHPRDIPHLERLKAEFDRVNREYFGSRLPRVPLRLSGRMRRRNGHFCADPLEIAISRSLCEAGAEREAERTLRHEMIHLWQWLEGRKPGHAQDFRRWARRLGIHPRATRAVVWARSEG